MQRKNSESVAFVSLSLPISLSIRERPNSAMVAFVKARALERKYHDFFDWSAGNANRFFKAFGSEFADACKAQLKNDKALENSVKAFLEIGQDRNLMVHENFALYPMNKTAEEVYELYKKAEKFVEYPAATGGDL